MWHCCAWKSLIRYLGTAANSLVDVFNAVARDRNVHLTYVIPISDNGGSSSELIRFVGGPSKLRSASSHPNPALTDDCYVGVGDIRSRLVRLIPDPNGDEERTALKALFEYRLTKDPIKARAEWLDIVEARHLLWTFISSQKRELIRSMLNTLNLEIVKRARPSSVFNFAEASLGNMFLTGARLFTGSLESAIYLLRIISAIPEPVSVLPAINSNFTHHISARLADGSQITGQVAISHPSIPATASFSSPAGSIIPNPDESDRIEDASLPGSLPILRRQHIAFSKDDHAVPDLPARIERIWYINPYGHKISPVVNPDVVAALNKSSTVIYSIGSLFTSLIPSLILRGVGNAIAERHVRHKILILNAKNDRETGPSTQPMTAKEYINAIVRAMVENGAPQAPVGTFVTHLLYLQGDGVPVVDVPGLTALDIVCVKVMAKGGGEKQDGMARYDNAALQGALEAIIDS
jgi:2-phospho-L-lactate transferase/gluconeogenesis factor (CofD/UPF0052 family)